jgi:SARP family transcriptional regulator, regulator of embCAB operon
MLKPGADEMDVENFLSLSRQGRALVQAGRYGDAAVAFEAAPRLCCGRVLENVPHGPIVEGFAAWVNEAELECTGMLIDAAPRWQEA